MPSMQFSFVPWQYEDPEPLIEHVKDLLDFRFSLRYSKSNYQKNNKKNL